jgi:hypothetical protein
MALGKEAAKIGCTAILRRPPGTVQGQQSPATTATANPNHLTALEG